MPFNTLTVGAAVTPAVIETYFSHYFNRKPLRRKPTAHISYHEGLALIRKFLEYASHHTVDEVQQFTSQKVPTPAWVKLQEVVIPEEKISEAANVLQAQLGPHGIEEIGGQSWWQWRQEPCLLKAEWIEMRTDYLERKKAGDQGKRVMLYVHGGAYFFGSVDEHRYQMQRHARKLKARVFAPRYRLAPQFPFPCGLHDCLAAYLYLLTIQDPSTIVLAGDSAGGGMVVSVLVTIRDRGLPMPAGAILISPWVDLTHSFPSVAGDSQLDYIPAHGFLQRPSASWPPPNAVDMERITKGQKISSSRRRSMRASFSRPHHSTKGPQLDPKRAEDSAVQGFTIQRGLSETNGKTDATEPCEAQRTDAVSPGNTIPSPTRNLSITLDGKLVEIIDQIQLYTTNHLLSHPLVSPVLQPSLGGLPPLLVLTGGGELLRDEQVYLAHKAANPTKYPPCEAHLDRDPGSRETISRYSATHVQLQVWDDLCHVPPTLSFTAPAKHMYRSIAQFGAWVLARAQSTEIEIPDDDDVSVISSDTDTGADTPLRPEEKMGVPKEDIPTDQVGRAGDPLPRFKNHMIRQRVDRHGKIYPLAPVSAISALQMHPDEIGVIKPGPVRKWLAAKQLWDKKYARQKRAVQTQMAREIAEGYVSFEGNEMPPPSALAGRRSKTAVPKEKKRSKSWGITMWSGWGSSHDEKTLEREARFGQEEGFKVPPEPPTGVPTNEPLDKNATTTSTAEPELNASTAQQHRNTLQALQTENSPTRSRSRRRRTVTDAGQANPLDSDIDENTPAEALIQRRKANGDTDGTYPGGQRPPQISLPDGGIFGGSDAVAAAAMDPNSANLPYSDPEIKFNPSLRRAYSGGIAFPFKLKPHKEQHDSGLVANLQPGSRLSPSRSEEDVENASTTTLSGVSGVIEVDQEQDSESEPARKSGEKMEVAS
ncbi:alpha/beta-hydrolase [Xylona heveae TC161]|uniref:Alpha/beta-hydrolase n=1 Tax=Xylona heveae (strain CBS 132557 / TC161) TaxID=1328760 RepID=A0A165FKI5_XYLHT|nr:alpha/beta-hydrolase [Xylona heveae TC161]KZF21083.1 alpha/beta-hydrolase [Xylona heveae TC161]